MVSQKEKKDMKEFVTARLEDTLKYNILQADENHILITTKPAPQKPLAELYIVLHNQAMTLSDYKKLTVEQLKKGRYLSNIFYKDDKAFMVRLGASGNYRADKSLKNYNHEQINEMIHLRGLEKATLENQQSIELAYYQPKTQRLEESIRRYNMRAVNLDYSHVPENDRAYSFVVNRESIDYKIADEILPSIQAGGIKFHGAYDGKRIMSVMPSYTGVKLIE